MLQRRRYSETGMEMLQTEDIPKRGMDILQIRRYSKKWDRNATKKKIFQKGGQ